ncbi:MAG: DUF885 domain-containing protein [candidate division KSB1 bacterium]|nr:DUF885 domain-containing protein [candidate division KSB1 bacterium]MDZ7341993.1 DUF885 domain-containing protein [candidate division KSB1 bacterium]
MMPTSSKAEAIFFQFLERLAADFPIACASDEFYYFPQVRLQKPRWQQWDCFSSAAINNLTQQMALWEKELSPLVASQPAGELGIDLALFLKISQTLREQLAEVRAWERQPTFYLTLVGIGLAEAMNANDITAADERAKGLPDFLDQARQNLKHVPRLFRDLGLAMLPDTRAYLISLTAAIPGICKAIPALDRFENTLRNLPIEDNFRIDHQLLERIIRAHLNCETSIAEANHLLDLEIYEMNQLLQAEAANLLASPNSSKYQKVPDWREAMAMIPLPTVGPDGWLGRYRQEVNKLAQHCLRQGWLSERMAAECPVHVTSVPQYLAAIRTASSYSVVAQHPPVGGTFYILGGDGAQTMRPESQRELPMLSAHETYPGHHLLDTYRWSMADRFRRSIEQPIFYEGWACFAEELMWRTGYFANAGDRLLLAKRRLWRAIRGKIDLSLQTGMLDLAAASQYLQATGVPKNHAMAVIQKYPLQPGYQLCYTIGLRRFINFFETYGQQNLNRFVQTVLENGEIPFSNLERLLSDALSPRRQDTKFFQDDGDV